MGIGGTLLLITIQAALSDHHGERRAIALTEANVAAAVAYVVLIGALSLAAVTGAGWRAALLASLALPGCCGCARRGSRSTRHHRSRCRAAGSRHAFWIAAAMLFCTTAAEWCVTAWGASFVEDAAHVSVDAAVAAMLGFFAGVVAGRVLGSRLTREHAPHRLLALALVVTALGFAVLWPASCTVQAVLGLRWSAWGWAICSRSASR